MALKFQPLLSTDECSSTCRATLLPPLSLSLPDGGGGVPDDDDDAHAAALLLLLLLLRLLPPAALTCPR